MIKNHLTSLPTKVKGLLRNKKSLLIVAVLIVLVGASLATVAVPSVTKRVSSNTKEHQHELQSAVDSSTGAPQNGRDPATQSQNSLASAASKPEGPGQRTDKPAADVSGDHDHHTGHSTTSGVTSGGCIIGYGKPDQCLQTPGEGKSVTCEYVHSRGFHNGLAVTGNDQFHLDKNHDKTACGHGD